MSLKKLYRVALVITCILSLATACRSESTVAPKPQPSSPTESTVPTPPTENVTGEITETEETTPVETMHTKLAPGEFSIGGFTLKTSRTEVIRQLGEPNSEGLYLSSEGGALEYDGITVFLREDSVDGVIATAPDFCTPSGVCPGDTVASVIERLGPTNVYTDEKGTHASYSVSPEDKVIACWMEVYINEPFPDTEDTVRDLRLVCQP